jgi:hypothetical protein
VKRNNGIKNGVAGFVALCAAMLGATAHAQGLYAGGGGGLFGWKIYAGYEISNYVAVEAAYVSMDDIISPVFTGEEREYVGTLGSVVGMLPLTDRSSVLARAGAFSWHAEEAGRRLESGTALSYGVGYQYKFGAQQNWAVRAELERFNGIGGLLSASILYRF